MSNYLDDPEIERLAEQFKALSNPQRLKLFLRLFDCCDSQESCCSTLPDLQRCVGVLASDLDITAPTVSHHVKELRRAGLISTTRRGRRIECRVSDETLARLVNFLDRTRSVPAHQGETDVESET